jgi:hypothetical protein
MVKTPVRPMRKFDLSRRLPCGLLLALGVGGASAQSAPIPGPATDLYAGTREYRWTFYVPVLSVERREIVVQGPGLAVRSKRFEYEVPGLKSERRRLGQIAEFYCKYPDLQLPNECGIAWHDVYADLPVLTTRHDHFDADVAEWTSEERRIRFDVPHWTWTERILTVVVPEFTSEPPSPRRWSQAPDIMFADESIERARAMLDSRQAEAVRALDAAVATLTSSIESVEAQGADASKLSAGDGSKVDLYATRQALLEDKARQVANYARVRTEIDAARAANDRAIEQR